MDNKKIAFTIFVDASKSRIKKNIKIKIHY